MAALDNTIDKLDEHRIQGGVATASTAADHGVINVPNNGSAKSDATFTTVTAAKSIDPLLTVFGDLGNEAFIDMDDLQCLQGIRMAKSLSSIVRIQSILVSCES